MAACVALACAPHALGLQLKSVERHIDLTTSIARHTVHVQLHNDAAAAVSAFDHVRCCRFALGCAFAACLLVCGARTVLAVVFRDSFAQ